MKISAGRPFYSQTPHVHSVDYPLPQFLPENTEAPFHDLQSHMIFVSFFSQRQYCNISKELLHYRHAIFSLCQAQENNCIESAPLIFFDCSIYIGLVILIYNQFMGIQFNSINSCFSVEFFYLFVSFFCLMEHFSFCGYICIICNNGQKVKRYYKLIYSQIFF